ncbi:ferric reductase family protein [Aspergillus saccharolyticus JOP 1030-1]|uniref:ferric-chelate reductase (NADPH) n=1 Tax=Aspergillus saccharolyticus JOP 1030-1 TaxID=1450539 RepID=A0A318Z944_9EURO|nr:ferric-chelate reductase [Aspergillus saccharolyticus JOP 1030-1]PYH42917.1 ferric-chelate reductase [Aspergillus saccharolyticus JOP 1030-1]
MGNSMWYAFLNDELCYVSLWVFACLIAVIFLWQTTLQLAAHLRRLATFTDPLQHFHRVPDWRLSWVKRHLLYAPLWRNRHNREMRLSRAINMGTLPSRFHALLLAFLVTMNVVLCTVTIPFGSKESTVAELIRNRTGYMATVNLFPLLVMAGRNNPLIPLLRVPFDTWNLLHRWLGRIVLLEAVAHVVAWGVPKVQMYGWKVMLATLSKPFMFNGLMCMVAMLAILIQSPSPIRHAFYETFLHLHIALACIALGFVWHHVYRYSCKFYLYAGVAFWAFERLTRLLVLLHRNFRPGARTTAYIEPLPGDTLRITLQVARPWRFAPGQHLFLCIPSVGGWTSHPFSVAWAGDTAPEHEKCLKNTLDLPPSSAPAAIALLVRRRTGFTDNLFKRVVAHQHALRSPMAYHDDPVSLPALQSPTGPPLRLPALIEGPYTSHHTLTSYGTILLVAGGVGITHCLPFLPDLLRGYAAGTVAARRITLVWIVQSPEHLEWIRPWMTEVLAMEGRRTVLRVKLFVTRPRNPREIQSPSATVEMFAGRPDVSMLVRMEAAAQVGAMGVVCCGSGGLSDEVRKACRSVVGGTVVDYFEEGFSW